MASLLSLIRAPKLEELHIIILCEPKFHENAAQDLVHEGWDIINATTSTFPKLFAVVIRLKHTHDGQLVGCGEDEDHDQAEDVVFRCLPNLVEKDLLEVAWVH
jgi:hypothetical protein